MNTVSFKKIIFFEKETNSFYYYCYALYFILTVSNKLLQNDKSSSNLTTYVINVLTICY